MYDLFIKNALSRNLCETKQCYLLLTGFNDEISQLLYVTVSAKERQSTGTFNPLVFHTDSAVDFGFVQGGPNFYPNTLQHSF
jgi:hypothetical protein